VGNFPEFEIIMLKKGVSSLFQHLKKGKLRVEEGRNP
jgi:hypothetical protein